VQSYLDQLDFGLVARRETAPHAQRIADQIAEDFESMRKADAESRLPGTIETIGVAARPVPAVAHKPIQLSEAKGEPRRPTPEKASALTKSIEAPARSQR